jgi:hypothetical protein
MRKASASIQGGNGGSNGPSIEFSLQVIRGLIGEDCISPFQAKQMGYVSPELFAKDRAIVTIKQRFLNQEKRGLLESVLVKVGRHNAKWYRPKVK